MAAWAPYWPTWALGCPPELVRRLHLQLHVSHNDGCKFFAGQWEALQKACNAEQAGLEDVGLQSIHGFVDHAVWMQRSSMVLHHGGMGTMLAALGAGLPAVACPLHFDQHQNVCPIPGLLPTAHSTTGHTVCCLMPMSLWGHITLKSLR